MTSITAPPTDLNEPGAIDALLAFHRSRFGAAVMEGEEGTDGGEGSETPPGEGEPQEGEPNSAGTEGEGEGETPKPKPEDELPDWARGELTKVRGEAANYRTKLREAEAKLSQAKTPEEFTAVQTELQTSIARLERELLVRDVATEHELPPELAELLKGDTPEELKAHAKKLAKFAGSDGTPGRLSGGLTPDDDDTEPSDPRAIARRYGRRR